MITTKALEIKTLLIKSGPTYIKMKPVMRPANSFHLKIGDTLYLRIKVKNLYIDEKGPRM